MLGLRRLAPARRLFPGLSWFHVLVCVFVLVFVSVSPFEFHEYQTAGAWEAGASQEAPPGTELGFVVSWRAHNGRPPSLPPCCPGLLLTNNHPTIGVEIFGI